MASPRGEALPRSGGDEEKLAFLFCLKICLLRNFQTKGRNLFSDTNNLNAALRGFPLGGSSAQSAVMSGAAHFWFSEYFQQKISENQGAVSLSKKLESIKQQAMSLDWKFRYKISIKNVLRPSFASHSLSTFPPRGRLYLLPYQGFPLGGSCRRKRLMRGVTGFLIPII